MPEAIASVIIQFVTNGLGIWVISFLLLCLILWGTYKLVDLSIRNKAILDEKHLEYRHRLSLEEKEKDREVAEYQRTSLQAHSKDLKALSDAINNQQIQYELLYLKVDSISTELTKIVQQQTSYYTLLMAFKSTLNKSSNLFSIIIQTILPQAEPSMRELLRTQLDIIQKSNFADEP